MKIALIGYSTMGDELRTEPRFIEITKQMNFE